jgi:putative SOS response-associated peptidase YedK
MCGRYALSASAEDIALQFDAENKPDAFLPAQWNISPTQPILIVNGTNPSGERREVSKVSWGLVPSWSEDTSRASNAINARVESISDKPSFRSAFRKRRCIIPATGYFEWATELGQYKPKQPFYIHNEDESLLAMAGIYEEWISPVTRNPLTSAAIITRESVGVIAPIHHRMPVLLPEDRWATWLSTDSLNESEVQEYLALLETPKPDAGLVFRPVSSAVNSARNVGPELIAGIELGEPETLF